MAPVDARVPRQFPTAPSGSSGSNGRAAPTIAERADALGVYEDAVQEPALECGNLASLYYNAQDLGSRRPEARVLREDFCSSAIVAQTWVGLDEGHRRAQGVDVVGRGVHGRSLTRRAGKDSVSFDPRGLNISARLSGGTRSPGLLRVAPVDRVEKIGEL